jgi:SpoVK/Ycf46/Vps4 family AAA+-type ATPase
VRRPGRFDKKIYVGPPDLEARIEAVKLYMKGRPQEEIDFFRLLEDKERYSFADLELVVNESARDALQTRQPIASRHIEEVFSRLPPSITIEVIEDMSKE